MAEDKSAISPWTKRHLSRPASLQVTGWWPLIVIAHLQFWWNVIGGLFNSGIWLTLSRSLCWYHRRMSTRRVNKYPIHMRQRLRGCLCSGERRRGLPWTRERKCLGGHRRGEWRSGDRPLGEAQCSKQSKPCEWKAWSYAIGYLACPVVGLQCGLGGSGTEHWAGRWN